MKKLFFMSLVALMLVCGVAIANRSNTVSKKAVVTNVANVSSSQSGYGYWVVITGNGVRIRTAPHLQGKIVGKVNRGTYLRYIDYVNGWYCVSYKGHARYVSAQYAYVE